METLGYGQTTRFRFTRRMRKGVIIIFSLLLAMATWYGVFKSTSVCSVCGATEDETEMQLPLTNVTYWRWSTVHATPLSTLLSQRGLVPPHQHTFLFAAGGGNGITCAVGQGRHLWPATTPEVARFLTNVDDCCGRREAASWVPLMLDPDRSSRVCGLAQMYPDAVSSDPDTFNRWWSGTAGIIAELKQP